MRIASAPNSSKNWIQKGTNNQSASEPQIHWPVADERRRLHFHLCNIFPKNDVEEAMSMYPEEVNPQKICSAILSIQNQKEQ